MERAASLCLCMIAKDEERNIRRCIESARELVQEIVLVDTGSSDATITLAEGLGAKVYSYAWDDSFANARNFAIGQTQSDWLLLLDADEALDKSSFPIITEFIHTTALDGAHFRIRNYSGRYSPDNYSLHSAMRLLRNNGKYRYVGEIHEQITSEEDEKISERFTTLDAIVHHYGYLDDIVTEKQKRKRNIPILENQLKKNPDEPFTLFNMGNEYLSMHEYSVALQYYQKALGKVDNHRIAFVPHLYFRMISSYESLCEHEQALKIIQAGLAAYPRCTDYEFLRAGILQRCKRYTLAIDSMEACLKMGNPPASLEFLPGCGTYRPAFQLGELYRELEDYGRAVKYYTIALSHKPDLYTALYRAGAALNRLYADKNEVRGRLFAYFENPRYAPNALVGADILVNEGLYSQALESLEDLTDTQGREAELAYVKGRALFYMGRLKDAAALLETACEAPEAPVVILRGIRPAGALMRFASGLMQGDETLLDRALLQVGVHCSPNEYAAAKLMKGIFLEQPQEDPHYENEGSAELAAMVGILGMLLKCGRLELFDRMLHALNYVDAKEVLLSLAELYDEHGYYKLAAEYALRSIKELDHIDAAGVGILFRRL